MKRKNILIVLFAILITPVFSQSSDNNLIFYEYRLKIFPLPLEDIYVPGYPQAVGRITYIGKNNMQQSYNEYVRLFSKNSVQHMFTNIKLLKVEQDAIRMLLNRYYPEKGDTFTISLNAIRYEYSVKVIVEYSSDTQFSYYYWAED